jgi:hypothetical protein
MQTVQMFRRLARKSPREILWKGFCALGETDWYWKIHSPKNDRTAYVIGLYGSGRDYIGELLQRHLGPRAKYFHSVSGDVRMRQVQTSMIYSGHATIKYPSIGQAAPEVTNALIKAAQSRAADLVFICRHPVDSLLTNWIWGLQMNSGSTTPAYVSQIYKDTDDLCAYLQQNFSNFRAFAEGDPLWFKGGRAPRFLSFKEFVEETELFLQVATLALRLEDFTVDPKKEFAKIVQVMSADRDLSGLQIDPPKARPYKFLAVRKKVPEFRDFLDELSAETKKSVEHCGYVLDSAEDPVTR